MAQHILMTGCSSGIGHHAAFYLRERGWNVIPTARKTEDVEALKAAGFSALRLDLADSQSIHQAVEDALALTGGTLDALFNNGAYGQPGALEDISRDAMRLQFETNLFGTHELTNAVIPIMRRQGRGRIIQNSSVLGFIGMPFRGPYNATKFALEGLSDTLRLELAPANIQVVLIEPGPITSRFRENAYEALKQHVDREHSPHRAIYAILDKRFTSVEESKYTLGPEAVSEVLLKALTVKRPKARYPVTTPTKFAAWMKRLLSDRRLDAILAKETQKEIESYDAS